MKRRPFKISGPLLALPLIFAASSCATITGVDPDPLEFVAEQVRPGGEDPIPHFAATGSDGQIRFQGAIDTPVPCYDVEGRIENQGDVVTLEVTATPRDVVCIQVLATFAYEGIVTGMDPGFYEVEIVHAEGDAREVVFEGAVEVE